MTRIVPSQVVATIDKLFTGPSKGAGTAALTLERLIHLQAILDLIQQIPNELLSADAAELADLTVATAAIAMTILRFGHGQSFSLPPVTGEDVIYTIRRVLSKCMDEAPPADMADLLFIPDPQVRKNMGQEIGAANSALQNAEWKAATVLGGAAIEALLHWKLSVPQTISAPVISAKQSAVATGRLTKSPSGSLDTWGLVEFIAVARELGTITEKTFEQADIARDYRNLIHPGYAARQQLICDRATALAVLSALEHVIRDLSRSSASNGVDGGTSRLD